MKVIVKTSRSTSYLAQFFFGSNGLGISFLKIRITETGENFKLD